jgi:hypothetical protein
MNLYVILNPDCNDVVIYIAILCLNLQQFLVMGRAKKFDDYINKLNKYCEALNPKKQQRSDMLTNERPEGSNLLKTGTQIQRYLLAQKTEDKPKNVVLNKQVPSSVTETKVCLQQDFEICSLFVAFTFYFSCCSLLVFLSVFI